MSFNCHRENIERVQRLGRDLPLAHASEVAWFYKGDGQGGRYRTLLVHLFGGDDVERLKWYVIRGLPLKVTLPDMAPLFGGGAYHSLCWMLGQWGSPPSVMWRIRRELPEFGTGRRLWRVRPDARRIGILRDFDPVDQVPLELPDGGQLWVDAGGLAEAGHGLGPATSGTLWVRRCQVSPRRRPDRVVLREAAQTWELVPEPKNDHQLRDLLPVVKEVDGVFLLTGLTLGKVWWEDYPVGGEEKAWIKEWTEGAAWERLRPRVVERMRAQRESNLSAPTPVLAKEELQGFPHVFHGWLRRGEDGLIGLDEAAAAGWPKVISDYREWEAVECASEREWVPDERMTGWSAWNEVPLDLRPWFDWEEALDRPSPRHLRHPNAYEKALCRRALKWSNERMIAGNLDALT